MAALTFSLAASLTAELPFKTRDTYHGNTRRSGDVLHCRPSHSFVLPRTVTIVLAATSLPSQPAVLSLAGLRK